MKEWIEGVGWLVRAWIFVPCKRKWNSRKKEGGVVYGGECSGDGGEENSESIKQLIRNTFDSPVMGKTKIVVYKRRAFLWPRAKEQQQHKKAHLFASPLQVHKN